MVESNDLLTRAFYAISAGGQETLQKPPVFSCADETHEPFLIMQEPVQYGGREDQALTPDRLSKIQGLVSLPKLLYL